MKKQIPEEDACNDQRLSANWVKNPLQNRSAVLACGSKVRYQLYRPPSWTKGKSGRKIPAIQRDVNQHGGGQRYFKYSG